MIEHKFSIYYPTYPHKILYSKLENGKYYKTYEYNNEVVVEEITEEEWAAHLLNYICLK